MHYFSSPNRKGLFARQGTRVSTICSTGQRVQDTFSSKNTTPCFVQRTSPPAPNPKSTFWQLEKQIQHRSRENKHGSQPTPVLPFHLCCNTPMNYKEFTPNSSRSPSLFAHGIWYTRVLLPRAGNPRALLSTHGTKPRAFTFFWSFSYSKLSIRFHRILLKQLHQENDSACGINYACTWPGTKGYEVGEGRIARHTQIKSPWISQMDPISSSYCRKSSCT